MTGPVAVDTNLLVVANGRDVEVDPSCQLAVVDMLLAIRDGKELLLDVQGAVLAEYVTYCNFKGAPGLGDEFFRWAFENQGFVISVALTEHEDRVYEEFPDSAALSGFDRSDRKFVALAAVSGGSVVNAVDSDYVEAADALAEAGIPVIEVCPCEVRRRQA